MSARNVAAVAAAAAGVYLLTRAHVGGETVGLAFAFANAALFTAYIVLAHRIARRSALGGIDGLAAAMMVGFLFVSPIGLSGAAHAVTDPVALAAGLGVGVCSSVIPYVFDQLAMARLPRATYALFVALLPATATVDRRRRPASAARSRRARRHRAGHGRRRAAPTPGRERRRVATGCRRRRRGKGERMTTPATPRSPWGNDDLTLAANVALDRLGLSGADAFLVIANPDFAVIAAVLAEAAGDRTDDVRVQEFPPTTRDGEEPPEIVATAMRRASAVAIVTRFSLSHTRARMAATDAGVRIASMPGITAAIFARAIPVDYAHLACVGRVLAGRLTEADLCRVTARGGTDIELSLARREAICDDGDLFGPGAWGNLPAGEAFIAPLESEGRGTIVFDGSLAGWGLLDEPLSIQLERGRMVSATGGAAAEWLLQTLDAGGENGRSIAELGIGTNPGATISGSILEDEKVEGTVHVAFGANTGIGGANEASVHIDGLVREARVELDGRTVLRDGRLLR